MLIYRTITVGDNLIQKLVVKKTTSHSVELAGSIDSDGRCTFAGSYSNPYGQFSKVHVTGYIKVTLEERYNAVTLEANKIKLESGTISPLTEERCVDSIHDYAF